MNKRIFNLSQNVLSALGQKPLLCHSRNSETRIFCSGCLPGETFECYRCHRLMPWCMGAGDVFENWCDECYGDYVEIEGHPSPVEAR